MKIPTVLALALLIIAIALGTFIYRGNQARSKIESISNTPSGIEAVNITDTQTSIIWQTKIPSSGLVSYGNNQFLGNSQNDDRDTDTLSPHLTHFVTIKNLTPDTQYYFRVRSGPYFYPDNPLQFKTAKAVQNRTQESSTSAQLNSPVFGVILSQDLNPVDEALVLLKIPGAADVATLTTTAGNFILPLVNLETSDLSGPFALNTKIQANLIAGRGNIFSTVIITIPSSGAPLPKIVLGQNSDFSSFSVASPSATKRDPLDLNNDGSVNTLDKSIVISNVGRSPTDPLYNPAADLNHDGLVDQKDVDLIKQVVKQ